ncbi:MAG: hypothetical protein JSS83_15745 [Cyanobacteria bacterium SZAS LIN-3]|nr:hypothetical protein [Cyanobacteria bacterium SZAS LIN-3]
MFRYLVLLLAFTAAALFTTSYYTAGHFGDAFLGLRVYAAIFVLAAPWWLLALALLNLTIWAIAGQSPPLPPSEAPPPEYAPAPPEAPRTLKDYAKFNLGILVFSYAIYLFVGFGILSSIR